MSIGQIFIYAAFAAELIAAALFVGEAKREVAGIFTGKSPNVFTFGASAWYRIAVGVTFAAGALLMYSLFAHEFQFTYVQKYSSSTLPSLYLISAFWAGQEGTFLFWTLMVGIMGLVFLKNKKAPDQYAMAIVSGFSAFLLLLLIVKSPFEILAGKIPDDGQGMNPLLQDPWMAIHPPILFIGYAASIFPFALVLSALIRRNNLRWFASGFSWSLFSALSLGTGIIIGGFWAYELLGWGGFWGWDPVENSSLVPWLMLLALIHGLLVQRTKNGLVRLNMFCAMTAFLLVLYATFLTRSGVLADFSVHSFSDLGITNYLIAIMAVTVIGGYGLFIARFRAIQAPALHLTTANREIALLLGMFVLMVSSAFTFAGMSSPIITKLFGKASQVDTSFYNTVNTPVAIVIGLLLGITPFLGWTGEEKPKPLLKRLSMPLLLTVLACAIALVAGVKPGTQLAFVAAATFGLVSNVIVAFRQYRGNWDTLGGPLAHIGTTLLFLGIIGSGQFDDSTQLMLKPGIAQSAFGYQFTFKDIDSSTQKTQVLIDVSDGRNNYIASPRLYFSEYNQGLMRQPDIKILPLKDIYIAPIDMKTPEVENVAADPQFEIAKGELKAMNGYDIEFVRFETNDHNQAGTMSVGALLDIKAYGKHVQVTPKMSIDQQGRRVDEPAELPASSADGAEAVAPHHVRIEGINVEEKKVYLAFDGFTPPQHIVANDRTLIIQVSTKPLMMVVWTGVILIIGGTLVAFKRRLAPVI
jgi:cytochrome c-type biogenesis protein CcmF